MKKLACRLGRHEWTTRVEAGERYKVCAVCGKTPRDRKQGVGPREARDKQPIDGGGGGGDPGIDVG